MKPTDQTLLQQFIRTRSSTVFDQLVQRHAGLIHSSILRKVRNPALAEDATQAVFLVLAQKAPTLADRPALGGWLLKTARYAAVDALRKESRHARHEKNASQQRHEAAPTVPPADEAQLTALDDALASLASADREALLLRYFQDESFADIAIALGTTEEAARKRTARALAKLRRLLHRRGTTSLTLAALATLLAGSAKTATAATFITPPNILAATSRGASISKGVLHMFTTAKLKLLAAVTATTVTFGVAGLVLYTAVHTPDSPTPAVDHTSGGVLAHADAPDPAEPSAAPDANTNQTGTLLITDASGNGQLVPVTQLDGTITLREPADKSAGGPIKTVVFILDQSSTTAPATPTEGYDSAATGQNPTALTGVSSVKIIAQGVTITNPDAAVPQPDAAAGKIISKMTIISSPNQPATLTVKNAAGESTTLSLPNGSTITTKKAAN